jgi:hypothetical protein
MTELQEQMRAPEVPPGLEDQLGRLQEAAPPGCPSLPRLHSATASHSRPTACCPRRWPAWSSSSPPTPPWKRRCTRAAISCS